MLNTYYNKFAGEETNATKLYHMSHYTIHPDYHEGNISNDIAVCKIIGIIKYSAEVGPVCLPFQHKCDSFIGDIVTLLGQYFRFNFTLFVNIYSDSIFYCLGWGLLEFGGAKSTTLQKADANVISLIKCKNDYNVKDNDTRFDKNICTYNKGKDACQV